MGRGGSPDFFYCKNGLGNVVTLKGLDALLLGVILKLIDEASGAA